MADGKRSDLMKADSMQNIDEAVADFLKSRQDRIAIRRARIGDKIARKHDAQQETASNASSMDFLTGADDAKAELASIAADQVTSAGGAAGGSARDKRDSKRDGSAGGGGGIQDLKKANVDSLDVQIEESRKQLEQIILDGESLITNVRIAAECREKTRHVKQTETRKERLDRLRQESEECQEMYESLKPNWDVKGEKILPLDLYAKVKAQQDACEELLTKKDDLIISLQREIEENDFEYENNLEKYQKDVSLLGDRIDDCVDDLQSAFLNELNLIEDYTCRNREVLLEENQREWMDLLGDFEIMEEGHLAERKKDALDKFKILNEFYITVKQECRAMRHKFEDDFRILIQELEQIKYATQLNMEKLQYNLAIIRKRFKENIEMKNMMKRLLLKFNDRFTRKSRLLKAKMEAGRKEAKKILNDIAKLEESLEMFGRKTMHLAVTDYAKYMDLWIVSEELVRERIQKLLDSEKFIFETQLGIEAPMPELVFMDERPVMVTKYMQKKNAIYSDLNGAPRRPSATEKGRRRKSSGITAYEDDDDLIDEPVPPKVDPVQNTKGNGCPTNPSLVLLPSDSVEFIPGPEPDPAVQRRLMKHVAKKICDESGFIIEEELRRLLEPLLETEKNLVNLDALLKALGINTVSEMQHLAHFLLKRCRVTKGVISRIGSEDSAHLTEMNVSLQGIVGKNAVDDLESGSASSKSKSSSPVNSIGDQLLDDDASDDSPTFKECECPKPGEDELEEEEEDGEGDEGYQRTSVEILHPPSQSTKERKTIDDSRETDACAVALGLADIDDEQISLVDITHPNAHCSPKCCSPTMSGETLEMAIVTVEDDEELEAMLNEDEEGEEEAAEIASKCSTCGGEPHDHQDCSFKSSVATVLSWVDPLDPPNKNLRDFEPIKQEVEDVEADPSAVVLTEAASAAESEQPQSAELLYPEIPVTMILDVIPKESIPEELLEYDETTQEALEESTQEMPIREMSSVEIIAAAHPDPLPSTASVAEEEAALPVPIPVLPPLQRQEPQEEAIEVLGEPVRIYDEIQPEARKSAVSVLPPPPQDEDDETDTVSIPSLESSTNGSEEFMYIEPDAVIEALTEFCKEYNANITVEPTIDELIDKKLKTFKYPKQSTLTEYWERPIRMLSAKSEDLWDTMQYCFEQYNSSLKERNGLVEQVTLLYKQNFELSHLMQKHVHAATARYLPKPSSSAPLYSTSNMKYC